MAEKETPRLWGGNYQGRPDRRFWEFNRSFSFDRRLLAEEIAASRGYVRALGRNGVIPPAEAEALDRGLAAVLERSAHEPGYLELDCEDVHSFVEARLTEQVGELAGQAHLARSRNEQTVTALRLWIRGAIDRLDGGVVRLVEALVAKGNEGADAVLPGYTHTRAAEPITLGHWAGAHAWALTRDHGRLRDARSRLDVLPLGSGALAGTPLPLDRAALARDLGFAAVSTNALDAVTDRDFAVEFAHACAQIQTHLSRLADDLSRFSAPELGFFDLPESFTSGSSLMPQKKNPDALELVRGKAARVDGDLLLLLTLLKGLPAGYQKDLQEDKEAVFDASDTVEASLGVMAGIVAGLSFRPEAMLDAASREELMAAGVAVALAREGIPFRRAHVLVGSAVSEAQRTGQSLRQTVTARLAELAPEIAARVDRLLDPAEAVRAKQAVGGTAPEAVRASLAAALIEVRRETGAGITTSRERPVPER